MLKQILFFTTLLICTQLSHAQVAIDSSFGTQGSFRSGLVKSVASVDVQADDKVLLAGTTPSENGYYVFRLKTNGTPDSSFNKIGYKTGTEIRTPSKILVLPDNKMLLMGTGYVNITGGFTTRIKILKLKANGTPDSTFGTLGWVTFPGNKLETASDMEVTSEGKIVVVGSTSFATGNNREDYLVVQYNANGTLDNTFNPSTPGYTSFTLGDPKFTQKLASLAIQKDNKLILGGTRPTTTDFDFDVACFRMAPTGTLDNTFNTVGYYTVNMGGENIDVASDIEILEDGKIVLVANTGGWAYNKLFRLNADGTRDNSFVYGSPDGIVKMARYANGFAVLGSNFISKIKEDGTWDKTVGMSGYVNFTLGSFLSLSAIKSAKEVLYVGGYYYENSAYKGMVFKVGPQKISTSLENQNELSQYVKAYPNPFLDELSIEVPSNRLLQVSIFDSKGNSVFSKANVRGSFSTGEIKTPGLYIVRFTDGEQIVSHKIVKSK